jgi:hypothetical protein
MSPLAVLTKLAAMLRNVPAAQFVLAKFAALLRNNESAEASGVIRSTVDHIPLFCIRPATVRLAVPETNDQPEREKLIRRRWTETGIKMWNPDVHGAGHAALKIQGRTELLPPKSGETLPGYDTLEFKMVRSCVDGQTANLIVCEGVVVDPPKPSSPPSTLTGIDPPVLMGIDPRSARPRVAAEVDPRSP